MDVCRPEGSDIVARTQRSLPKMLPLVSFVSFVVNPFSLLYLTKRGSLKNALSPGPRDPGPFSPDALRHFSPKTLTKLTESVRIRVTTDAACQHVTVPTLYDLLIYYAQPTPPGLGPLQDSTR